ncbi:hypothetical protein JX265_005894 [Neoarthrinium moseri]|uniref:Cyclin-dependent kinase n=1 Tax=Neoarthrinium moseri TaxID=1658444 RepID=A0A9P9WNM1_9PEZI|nr:uncharacterized protein JN550_002142 [Neoarthrinium moseri]KAI1848109.1 hypothetical protein JX266_005822 [Neoarthrinium moseri]KAI1871908.1 hypothetical protein JX265_005894 [Neoarthrinium moseri]KAI1875856.1 hypothetical protein JN550_002142 [Neoarthrinium moseri]
MLPVNDNGYETAVARPNGAREPGSLAQNKKAPGSHTQQLNYSSNDDSQDTTATHDSDRVFTPPDSDSGASSVAAPGNGNASSQESQLLQLSQLAAAQEKMADAGQSRKRMADGAVKHTRDSSSTSPVRMQGHSRNTSTVSVASTAGSRIGELSAELKTKLSYAMMKVNNGWQSHSIDEVESLASHVASPTSSTSTVHGRHGTSASPRVVLTGMRQGASSAGISPISQQAPQGRTYESFWRENNSSNKPQHHSASPPTSQVPMLAPPAAIQPGRPGQINPRRNSNARYTPTYLSQQASPHTPAQPSPLQSTPGTTSIRTPQVDPILYSPHQNVREQEALETLIFMSSPGNSANLKHTFPSSQPSSLPSSSQPQRTALPTSRLGPGPHGSQNRKQLPTGRHQAHASTGKRVGFEKSPSNASYMDVDGSPRGTPRRKTIGGSRPSIAVSAGLGGSSQPRPQLQDDDIERMLDRVAADDSSDSEGEISLPRDRRREGAGVGV